jgi:deoxyadenosine/deoxycytidine kinase
MTSSRPIIAEIVGPAGTGKTTLSKTLNDRGGQIYAGISVWGQPVARTLAGALISLPTICSLYLHGNRYRVSDLKRVAQITALYRQISRRQRSFNDRGTHAFFMDEGVVFALTQLRVNRSGKRRDPSDPMLEWERKMIDRWSQTLNAIVWLDGPDDLLTERIRTREKAHRMKTRSDTEIVDFLSLYRSSYQEVISELRVRGRIEVMKFQTGEVSPDRIARQILRLVEQPRV